MPYGDYKLEQIEAPARYRLNPGQVKIALYDDQKSPVHTNRKKSRHEEELIIQPKPEPQKPETEIIPEPNPAPEPKPDVPVVPAPIQPVAPDPIVYRELVKKQEERKTPSNVVEVVSKEDSSETLIKSYVKRLPKT